MSLREIPLHCHKSGKRMVVLRQKRQVSALQVSKLARESEFSRRYRSRPAFCKLCGTSKLVSFQKSDSCSSLNSRKAAALSARKPEAGEYAFVATLPAPAPEVPSVVMVYDFGIDAE